VDHELLVALLGRVTIDLYATSAKYEGLPLLNLEADGNDDMDSTKDGRDIERGGASLPGQSAEIQVEITEYHTDSTEREVALGLRCVTSEVDGSMEPVLHGQALPTPFDGGNGQPGSGQDHGRRPEQRVVPVRRRWQMPGGDPGRHQEKQRPDGHHCERPDKLPRSLDESQEANAAGDDDNNRPPSGQQSGGRFVSLHPGDAIGEDRCANRYEQ
jgi:hypothetical protein